MEIFLHPVFRGITPEELSQMEAGGAFQRKRFRRGEYILRAGGVVSQFGLVCRGSVQIECSQLWGERSILSLIETGGIFAESYALCAGSMMVDAVAAEDAEILFLSVPRLLGAESRGKTWYPALTQNLLRICAQKNLTLSGRIFCTSSRSVRSRILTYLSGQAALHGSREFEIPFDRQQLADYLSLDRSALSRELETPFAASVCELSERWLSRQQTSGSRQEPIEALRELSERERSVAQLMALRKTNREIAETLFLSEGTVKQYINRIYSKLQLTGTAQEKRRALTALLQKN